ncbi:hypothetical protein LJC18_03655 [Lachnospiraceae bacterium OttesenSCG-928-E19]|nr:hypothetical protein [Lachnospiraceae bacterium OttesenSCG-928-E19]
MIEVRRVVSFVQGLDEDIKGVKDAQKLPKILNNPIMKIKRQLAERNK